jgi:nitrilase
LFDADGALVANYRKIHLFDVDVPGARFVESADVAPGDAVVAVDAPVGRLGLSICYDLRFPELYRALRDQGAEILLAPAAFTAATGRAHWDVLTRARAIEQQCYVVAPAQRGEPVPGRACHGHARVVDPWGAVIAEVADGDGYAIAEVDLAALARVREGMPVREHRRLP